MSGPWENYQAAPVADAQADGPWARYSTPNTEIDPTIARVDVTGHREQPSATPEQPHNLFDTIAALPGHIKESLTGDKRHTATTDALPDWAGMPELNSFSLASAKTGLGTILSNPAETVKVIQANFPGVKARQDEKGNFLLRSSIDGREYAIKPGFQLSDVPRAAASIAVFTPAGRATTIGGAALASAGTQAAIEATQAATGGEFNPGEVAAAGVLGGAVPAVAQGVRAVAAPVRQLVQRARGESPAVAAEPAAAADPLATAAAGAGEEAAGAQQAAPPVAPAASAPAASQPAVHPLDGQISALEQRYQDLLSQSANTAPKGAIREARQQLDQLSRVAVDTSDAGVRAVAKQIQSTQGVSYKAALSQAKRQVSEQAADHQARVARLEGLIEENRTAANATRELHEVGDQLTTLRGQKARTPFETQSAADDSVAAGQDAAPASSDAPAAPGAMDDFGPQASAGDDAATAAVDAQAAAAPIDAVAGSGAGGGVPNDAPSAMSASALTKTARKAAEGGMGSKKATKVLAEQAAPDPKMVQGAARLGVENDLQSDHVTTSQAYREVLQAAKSIPGSAARAAELEGLKRIAQRADKLIEDIGGTHDVSTLNRNLKREVEGTHNQLKSEADKQFAELRAKIPAKADAPADNVLAMIHARADELGGVKNLSTMEKTILAKLSPKTIKQAETVPGNPLMPGAQAATKRTTQAVKQPTYALVDDVRRDLTAAKYSRQGPFKDSDDRLITLLEGALRKDQQAIAEQHGMGELWNLAQKTSATYKAMQRDLIELFGEKLNESFVGDLAGAVKALPAGDPTKFLNLMKSIPESMRQEVVASGLNTAFGKTAKQHEISFGSFAKWYEGLVKNKQSYTAIMTYLPPGARKQLSDLYRVSKGISAASKERIPTGRIRAIEKGFQPADKFAGRLLDAVKHQTVAVGAGTAAGGATGAMLGPAAGAAVGAAVTSALSRSAKSEAMMAFDKLIISPEFVNLARNAGGPGARQATLHFIRSTAWKRFAHFTKLPANPTAAERWVTQALQADNQQGSEDEDE